MENISTFDEWSENGYEYIKCKDCHSFFRVYKPRVQICKYCGSKDINFTSKEEYDFSQK